MNPSYCTYYYVIPPGEFGPFLWSNLSLAWKGNTHHLLLMLSWDLLSDDEELQPLESGGLMSSMWGREGWEGEKPLCGEDGVRAVEPARPFPSASVPELLLLCRVGVPAPRPESPPSLASCFRLRYSRSDTWGENTALSQGTQRTRTVPTHHPKNLLGLQVKLEKAYWDYQLLLDLQALQKRAKLCKFRLPWSPTFYFLTPTHQQ